MPPRNLCVFNAATDMLRYAKGLNSGCEEQFIVRHGWIDASRPVIIA